MILDELIEFEQTAIHYRDFPPDSSNGIAVRVGSLPVVFSAPHACRHKRAGRWKQEDEYTATIAEWLHRTLDTHAIYLTHQIDPDPHDDDHQNLYKRTLAAFIAEHPSLIVIDLHGVRGDRDFGIALGTMNNLTCPQYQPVIVEQFERCGFRLHNTQPLNRLDRLDRLILNHPRYTGGLQRPTITRFAYEQLKLPALQVEINAWLRVLHRTPDASNAVDNIEPEFEADRDRFFRLMDAFSQLVTAITHK